MVTIVIGAQWGDEGKGKIVDFFAKQADYVVRFNGGNNAGHTIINKYGKFANHLVPAGIFHKKAVSLITNGVVVDPEVLILEIETIKKAGIDLNNRLFLSPRCHLILPYHKALDALYEQAKGKGKTGTTGRGIGPAYADKVSYNGIRIADLLDDKIFAEKLKFQLDLKNKIIQALGGKPLFYNQIYKEYLDLGKRLKPYARETFTILNEAMDKKKNIIFEGAQGVFLDNDWGTYPFVSASSVVSGNATAGAGIPPQKIGRIVGVAKAYATRVGEGPFPTELFDKDGEKLRKEGKEFGTTTGRPRRCGWFDSELIRFAARLNGFTEIILTKLDILDGFAKIKICTGYRLNGKSVNYVDGDSLFLAKIKPVYQEIKGWKMTTAGIKRFADLPKQAKDYIKTIEELVGVRISYISNGAKSHEIVKV
ncbi:adenylosuccinate synthase [Candidatus Microgenomates bacterium]|nr:adenylosuccinate synthase [Candidatus Microgenomates bacterium]